MADRIPATEQQVSGVDDVLLRDAHDDVGAGMPGVTFEDGGKAPEFDGHGKFCRVDGMIGQCQDGGFDGLEHAGVGGQIALCMLTLDV